MLIISLCAGLIRATEPLQHGQRVIARCPGWPGVYKGTIGTEHEAHQHGLQDNAWMVKWDPTEDYTEDSCSIIPRGYIQPLRSGDPKRDDEEPQATLGSSTWAYRPSDGPEQLGVRGPLWEQHPRDIASPPRSSTTSDDTPPELEALRGIWARQSPLEWLNEGTSEETSAAVPSPTAIPTPSFTFLTPPETGHLDGTLEATASQDAADTQPRQRTGNSCPASSYTAGLSSSDAWRNTQHAESWHGGNWYGTWRYQDRWAPKAYWGADGEAALVDEISWAMWRAGDDGIEVFALATRFSDKFNWTVRWSDKSPYSYSARNDGNFKKWMIKCGFVVGELFRNHAGEVLNRAIMYHPEFATSS